MSKYTSEEKYGSVSEKMYFSKCYLYSVSPISFYFVNSQQDSILLKYSTSVHYRFT